VAIDTNIYVAFKSNHPAVVETFRNVDRIGVDIAVVAELLTGFALGGRERENRRELEAFLDSPRVEVWPHDLETAEHYAAIIKALKRKGRPIPTNDIWIAANALRHAVALHSLDRHFEDVPGLRLVPGQE
jgi:predicted nucleic acid-binding protein